MHLDNVGKLSVSKVMFPDSFPPLNTLTSSLSKGVGGNPTKKPARTSYK
jgi:hypothetical protein